MTRTSGNSSTEETSACQCIASHAACARHRRPNNSPPWFQGGCLEFNRVPRSGAWPVARRWSLRTAERASCKKRLARCCRELSNAEVRSAECRTSSCRLPVAPCLRGGQSPVPRVRVQESVLPSSTVTISSMLFEPSPELTSMAFDSRWFSESVSAKPETCM